MKRSSFPSIIEKYLPYIVPAKFRNLLAIHLLSTIFYDPDSKYLTSGYQQRFVSSPWDCLEYQPHCALCAYLEDLGRMSVILDTVSPIDSVLPDYFHHLICMEPESPLFISPYNIRSKIPLSHLYPLTEFIQCGKNSKMALSLPSAYLNSPSTAQISVSRPQMT